MSSVKLVFNKILCVHPFLKKIFYYIMGKKHNHPKFVLLKKLEIYFRQRVGIFCSTWE